MKPLFRSLASILALALCLCTAPLLVSCSDWDQDLTKATSDSSESESYDTDVTVESDTSTSQQHELVTRVNEFMETLVSGDPDAVSQIFGLNRIEVLFPSREDAEDTYAVLSQHASYVVGSVFAISDLNFSVDVAYGLPDIRSCFFDVLGDTTFMEETSREWVDAMIRHTEISSARDKMIDTAFQEALRRIREGEYSGKYMLNGSFQFHKNPDKYVLEKTPDFVTFFGFKDRLAYLRYVDPAQEYDLLVDYLAVLVEKEEVAKEVADTILLEKKEEIQGAY